MVEIQAGRDGTRTGNGLLKGEIMLRHKKEEKVHKVMREFQRGTLRSSSGKKVIARKQAVAIGMSEAGLSRKK